MKVTLVGQVESVVQGSIAVVQVGHGHVVLDGVLSPVECRMVASAMGEERRVRVTVEVEPRCICNAPMCGAPCPCRCHGGPGPGPAEGW